MFTLLRNYKAMLMMCIANYQQALEGPVSQAVQDEELSFSEIQNLSELPNEVQEVILAKMEDKLSLTGDIASQLGDVTPDSARDNPTMKEQKTVQFIMNLFLKASDKSTINVDGRIGDGTKGVLKEIMSDYDGGVIDQERISLLIEMTNTQLSSKIAEVKAAREAQEASESEARELLSEYGTVDEIKALTRDERKSVQEALKTLGYYTMAIDGDFGNGSTTAFNTYVDEVREAAEDAAVVEAGEAVTDAQGVVDRGERWEERLHVDVARERGEMERVERDLKEAEILLTRANNVLNSAQRMVDSQETEVTDRDADKTAAEAALLAAQTALTTAQAEVTDRDTDKTAAEAALLAAQTALTTAQAEVTDRDADKAAAEADLLAAQTALTTAQTEVTDRDADKTAAESALLAAQTALTTAQTEVTDRDADKTAAESALLAAQTALTTAQTEITDRDADKAAAEADLAEASQKQDFLGKILGYITAFDDATWTRVEPLIDMSNPILEINGEYYINFDGISRNYKIPQADITALGITSVSDISQLLKDGVESNGSVKIDLLSSAQSKLTIAESALLAAQTALTTAQTEVTDRDADKTAAEASLLAAQTALTTAQTEVTDRDADKTAAESALLAAQTALTTAQTEITDRNADKAAAEADLLAAQTALTTAQAEVTDRDADKAAAEADLLAAQTELASRIANRDSKIVDFTARQSEFDGLQSEYDTQRAEYQNMVADRNLADIARQQAGDNLEAAKEAELDAYINDLTNGGTHEELVGLLESDPKLRELIDGMRDVDPAVLGRALAYFGEGVELGATTEVSAELVVAVVNYAKSQEGFPLSLGTAEYIVRLNDLYQEKADELGKMISDANTRSLLSTGYAAAENMFNTTVGIPDLELVVHGEDGGIMAINNGFRGRPRCHHHTVHRSHTTHTDMTTNTHHSEFLDGENIASTHASSTERLGSVTTRSTSTSTRRWFEMYRGGIERDAMSELINAGKAHLRPSYELMNRLYSPGIENGQVTLVAEKWYEEMMSWQADLEQRGGEETIINTEVSIRNKTLSGAMAEVEREAPERHGEIISEVRASLAASQEFSFMLWDHVANKQRGTGQQLIGRQENGVWRLALMNPSTGETIGDVQEFSSADEMLNSDLGQTAIEMSSYRYLGVVNSTTEGGLRIADDQGLIRCGDHEKVVLLDEPAPELPQGYNFIRTGLPCGVLGAFCTSSSESIHTSNVRNLERDLFTEDRRVTPEEPDDDDDEPDGPTTEPGEDATTSPGEDASAGVGDSSEVSDGDTEGAGGGQVSNDNPQGF